MSFDNNLPRWIFASVTKHFFDGLDALNDLPIIIEGQHKDDIDSEDYYELRINGPVITQLNSKQFQLEFEINMIVSSTLNDTNFHRLYRYVGDCCTVFFTKLQIFKYGDGSNDDSSLLSCAELVQDSGSKDAVIVQHYGQIDPNIKLLQATVSGKFIILTE